MRIGLRDLFRAPITISDNGVETYGTPVRIARAIQADIAPTSAEATLYSDDAIDVIIKQFSGGTLTLGMNDLIPSEQAALLGQTQDADGVVYAGESDDPPYHAIGFRALKANGLFRYLWLYKVKFGIPTENHATKGDSINFQTPQLVGTFQKRLDGLWKADATLDPSSEAAQKWFNEVREPNPADPPDSDPTP